MKSTDEWAKRSEIMKRLKLDDCGAGTWPECGQCYIIDGLHIFLCMYERLLDGMSNLEKITAAGYKPCDDLTCEDNQYA